MKSTGKIPRGKKELKCRGKKNQRQAYTITQTCPMKSGLNIIHGLGGYEVIGLCGGEEIKARSSGTEESEAVGK